MNNPTPQRRPLGQILMAKGILSEDQLRIALLEQMKANQPIGKLLVSLGFVSETTLREALSESLGQQSIDLSNAIVDPQALKLVPRDIAKRHHLLPLDYDTANHRLTLAIADIHNIVGLDRVRTLVARACRDRNAARQRIRGRPRHRPVLRLRAVDRRHPAGDRNRRNRLEEPVGNR